MKRRSVSSDERELWRRAVQDVSPLRRVSPKTAYAIGPQSEPSKSAGAPPLLSARQHQPAAVAGAGHFVLGGGDPRLDRAASSRRVAIERTLDLHGMTQVEAHRALLQFMAAAAQAGARLVLVVTGKGKPAASETRGGVLKSRFLDWIEERPLKSVIARVAPAKQKDGGGGAFYVFLKRKSAGNRRRF